MGHQFVSGRRPPFARGPFELTPLGRSLEAQGTDPPGPASPDPHHIIVYHHTNTFVHRPRPSLNQRFQPTQQLPTGRQAQLLTQPTTARHPQTADLITNPIQHRTTGLFPLCIHTHTLKRSPRGLRHIKLISHQRHRLNTTKRITFPSHTTLIAPLNQRLHTTRFTTTTNLTLSPQPPHHRFGPRARNHRG